MSEEKPKLQIDSDWKKQAQAEKERLAQQVEGKPATPGGAGPGVAPGAAAGPAATAAPAPGPEGLPPPSFGEIIVTLATQVLMFLGEIPTADGRAVISLPLAKHYIDLLAILEEKTRGNLTGEEKGRLDSLLYETRMHYVQLASSDLGMVGRPTQAKKE